MRFISDDIVEEDEANAAAEAARILEQPEVGGVVAQEEANLPKNGAAEAAIPA
jgi:hypothetical protein